MPRAVYCLALTSACALFACTAPTPLDSDAPVGSVEPEVAPAAPGDAPSFLTISEPVASGSVLRDMFTGMFVANRPDGAAPVSFVSFPPGALPNKVRVTVRNLTMPSFAPTSGQVAAGGLDPVAIAARPDDMLEIGFVDWGGGVELFQAKVPARKKPVVVRVEPPSYRFPHPSVIFSEPVDPATLSLASVHITDDRSEVGIGVRTVPGQPVAILSAMLTVGISYEIVIEAGLKDLHGEALDPVHLPRFTAMAALAGGPGRAQPIFNPLELPQFAAGTPPLGGSVAFVSNVTGVTSVFVADGDGSRMTRIAEGEAPAWSAANGSLAYVRGGNIYVQALGAPERLLTSGDAPTWSQNDSTIVFTRPSSGTSPDEGGIFAINADGSGSATILMSHDFARVGSQAGTVMLPSASPDGSRIAFLADAAGDSGPHIYLMNADGTNTHLLTPDVGVSWPFPHRPAWSADGSKILAVTNLSGSVSWEQFGIATYDTSGDGTGTLLLSTSYRPFIPGPGTGTLGFYREPAFTGDGQGITFTAVGCPGGPVGFDGHRVFVMNLGTRVVKQFIGESTSVPFSVYGDEKTTWTSAIRP